MSASHGLTCGYCKKSSIQLDFVALLCRLSTLVRRDLVLHSCLEVQRNKRNSNSIAAKFDRESAPWLFYGIPARSRRSGGPLPPLNKLQQQI